MLLTVATVLLLSSTAGSRPTNLTDSAGEKTCRVGNVSFPVSVFESYAGWECYEETYTGMKELTVHVCLERADNGEEYSVPCFKWKGSMLSFNLKDEDSVLAILNASGSRELNDEMIRCYLSVVTACETSPDGWLGVHGGCRSFLSNTTDNVCGLEGQSKFHIAMLSISLIIGIPVVVVFLYCAAATGSEVVGHCRNLVVALNVRTLFTLLIETEVISEIIQLKGEPVVSWAGCEALAAFETIALNVVLAFWLILSFCLFESSKSQFEKAPSIRKGVYIVFGLSLTFPVIWMIIMGAGGYGNCWLERTPVQWVNDALRLGFVLLQIALTSFTCFRILTDIRGPVKFQTRFKVRVAVTTLLLSPLFLLQFSLSASHPLEIDGEAHIYTEFFFDGLQCAIVSSAVLYVSLISLADVIPAFRSKKCHRLFETMGGSEMELRRGDEPPRAARSPTRFAEEERKDITYTSVLSPERFERTIKLYNRLNVIPKQGEPIAQEPLPDNSSVKSEYFDVDNDSVRTVYNDVVTPTETKDPKNLYYSSRYLVHDTESSVSEDSVIEMVPPVAQCSSSSSSSVTLPRGEVDASREIEEWLANCRCEFQDYAERALRNKAATPSHNAIHRSLSGSILTGSHLPGSVRFELKEPRRSESVRAMKGSAPSLLPDSPEEEIPSMKPKPHLPSIYDDLKVYPRVRNAKPARKRDYSAEWSTYRNRVLDKRRKVKSFDDLDPPGSESDGLSPQLNALLTPSSEGKVFQFGSLRTNHFSGMEDLTRVGDGNVSANATETCFNNDREKCSAHEGQLSDANHVKI